MNVIHRSGSRLRLVLAGLLAATAVPVLAQDTLAEARLRRIEAEVRALQGAVFPGNGKVFTPQSTPATTTATVTGTPATTPLTDLLGRMDAVEAQLARLTSQSEENANRLRQVEAKLGIGASSEPGASPAPAATPPAAVPTPATSEATVTATNLEVMTGGASAPKPVAAPPTPTPTPVPIAVTTAPKPAAPAAARPATTRPAAPSAARVAAVRAIVKPQTDDAGDDEYSYGYRLWEAKFYPEAQQQLQLYLTKYPRHARVSFARNLLGRAFLDDGKPRDAATWFLQNYQNDKRGDRAPDSLLYLAEAMGQLKDTNRACIALAEFTDTYPRESAGRLKVQFDATKAKVKCN